MIEKVDGANGSSAPNSANGNVNIDPNIGQQDTLLAHEEWDNSPQFTPGPRFGMSGFGGFQGFGGAPTEEFNFQFGAGDFRDDANFVKEKLVIRKSTRPKRVFTKKQKDIPQSKQREFKF